MPIEPLPDVSGNRRGTRTTSSLADQAELPVDLSQFSQRLASFGLGESPDPLLTEARPPAKRRPQN